MPSPESLRRLANLTKKVRNDLRKGGMAINFRYVFRSTAILARIVEVLADQVATMAEEQQQIRQHVESKLDAPQSETESDATKSVPSRRRQATG